MIMSWPLNPPTLQRVEFDRVAVRLGQVWELQKNGRTLVCSLWTHPVAWWELRLTLGAELLQSKACRQEREVFDTADEWRIASEAKGWTAAR
jgi:hypothetical protein